MLFPQIAAVGRYMATKDKTRYRCQPSDSSSTVLLMICLRFNAAIGTGSHAGNDIGSSVGRWNQGGTTIDMTLKVAPKIAPEEAPDTTDGECD